MNLGQVGVSSDIEVTCILPQGCASYQHNLLVCTMEKRAENVRLTNKGCLSLHASKGGGSGAWGQEVDVHADVSLGWVVHCPS